MSDKSDIASGEISIHSPAKVNLMLSVHGRRPDGFHELTSLMVALKFGDTLRVRISDSGEDTLVCSDPAVPSGPENLVLKAAESFRVRLECAVYFDFELKKRIPMGAGLGGGSSNAVAALSGMNRLLDKPLGEAALYELAAELGSDCSFFIEAKPAWIFGRGERIDPLSVNSCEQLHGTPLILFKPNFEVNTAWAYKCLATNASKNYRPEPVDATGLENSIRAGAFNALLYNSFEAPVGKKYVALPTLLHQLQAAGVICMMSGSGSSCFALPDSSSIGPKQIKKMIVDAWGEDAFWVETSIC